MSSLDKSFAFVMAVESIREYEKEKKDNKKLVGKRRDIPGTLCIALESRSWNYNCSELVQLDEEDIKLLYDKHKAILKNHLLKSL